MEQNKSKRFEIKFQPSEYDFYELEALILMHPFHFRRVYHSREVNNIYFDSPDLNSYLDNVEGETERAKVRVRWYGDLCNYQTSSHLEIKRKSGPLGWKEHYALGKISANITNRFNAQDILIPTSSNQKHSNWSFYTSLSPILVNRYTRDYYLSSDGRFRLTLDRDLKIFDVNPFRPLKMSTFNEKKIILELKFSQSDFERCQVISQNFPFRISKSSKYVYGVELLRLVGGQRF